MSVPGVPQSQSQSQSRLAPIPLSKDPREIAATLVGIVSAMFLEMKREQGGIFLTLGRTPADRFEVARLLSTRFYRTGFPGLSATRMARYLCEGDLHALFYALVCDDTRDRMERQTCMRLLQRPEYRSYAQRPDYRHDFFSSLRLPSGSILDTPGDGTLESGTSSAADSLSRVRVRIGHPRYQRIGPFRERSVRTRRFTGRAGRGDTRDLYEVPYRI